MSMVYHHLKKKFEKPESAFVQRIEKELERREFPP